MRILLLTICSLFAIIAQSFASSPVADDSAEKGGVYALVTSTDQIVNGGTYIVAGYQKEDTSSEDYNLYLMSTQKIGYKGFEGVAHGILLPDTLDLRNELINTYQITGGVTVFSPYDYIIEKVSSKYYLKDNKGKYVRNNGGLEIWSSRVDAAGWTLDKNVGDNTNYWIGFKQSGEVYLKYTSKFATGAFTTQAKNPHINLYKKSEPVTFAMTQAKYATLYYENEDILLPEGLGAYTITVSNVNDILKPVVGTQYASGDIIPAGTGVVVYGAAGEYQLQKLLKNVHATAPSSSLVGSDNQTSVTPEANYYVLSYKNDNYNTVGFYKATSAFQNGAHKAYLVLNEEVAARLSSLLFKDLDNTTGVQLLTGGTSEKEDATIYDLNGRSVSKPSKGIYIRNHKTFIVK